MSVYSITYVVAQLENSVIHTFIKTECTEHTLKPSSIENEKLRSPEINEHQVQL